MIIYCCCVASHPDEHKHNREKLSCIQCIHFNFSLKHAARLHHVVVNRRVPIGWPTVTLSTQHRSVSMQRSKEVFQDRYYFLKTLKNRSISFAFMQTHTHTHTFLRNSVYENCIICTELLLISDLHEKVVPMYIPIIRSICYI